MSGMSTRCGPLIHQLQFRDKISNPLCSSYGTPNPNSINFHIYLAGIKTNHGEIVQGIELIGRARQLSAPTHNRHKIVYGRALYP